MSSRTAGGLRETSTNAAENAGFPLSEIADEMLRHVVAAYNAKMAAIEVWGQLHCEATKQDNAPDSALDSGQLPPSPANSL